MSSGTVPSPANPAAPPGLTVRLAPLVPPAALLLAIVLARDEAVFRALQSLGGVAPAAWAALSVLGLGVSALLLPALARRRAPLWLSATLWGFPLAGLGTQLAKQLLMVPRPVAVLGLQGLDAVHAIGQPLTGRSFPSGHAVTAFACASLAIWVGPRWLRHPAGAAFAIALASLIAVSRSVTGAHWPIDLVAGAVIGWAAARLALELARRSRLGGWLAGDAARVWVAAAQVALGVGVWLSSTGYPSAWPMQVALGLVGVAGGFWTLVDRGPAAPVAVPVVAACRPRRRWRPMLRRWLAGSRPRPGAGRRELRGEEAMR